MAFWNKFPYSDFHRLNLDWIISKFESIMESLSGKQDTLVSGSNIKTVNSNSLLGSGDVTLTASDVGALADDTTYVSSFNGSSGAVTYSAPVSSVNTYTGAVTLSAADVGAQETLVSGTNIKTINNYDLLGSGNITISGGGGGGVTEFNDLNNRPQYNSVMMTSSTNVPEVKTVTWDAKYDKPSGGIPKTDLASSVQTSLGLADTALQSAPVTSVNSYTGAVSLTASDVGALASNTTYVSSFNGSSGAVTYSAPVSSVNGSTGAVTLSAADVGATAVPTLIWSNPNPAAAFGESAVEISNLTSYNSLYIYYKQNTGADPSELYPQVIKKPAVGNSYWVNGNYAGKFTRRRCEITATNEITFGNSRVYASYAGSTTDDGLYLIPFYIYAD